MRVGILTFSRANNYGAALQAFALLKKMQALRFDAQLIDYACPAIDAMHAKRPVGKGIPIRKKISNLLYNTVFSPRRRAFRRFREAWGQSRPYDARNIAESNRDYDLFVTGSDQVFNLPLTGNDTSYFLDFVGEGKKKASYAASIGIFLPEEKEKYRTLLSDFSAVSVREPSAAALLEPLLGAAPALMPDPVFLHKPDEWRDLLGVRKKKGRPYLLIYALVENRELYTRACAIAKKRGLRTVVLTRSLKPAGKTDRVLRSAGPREFVALIDNASFVVTNSFHGTVFSLLFEKEISVVPPPAAPERIIDLLESMSLGRLLEPPVNGDAGDAIDFAPVHAALAAYRETGEAFLRALSDEEHG